MSAYDKPQKCATKYSFELSRASWHAGLWCAGSKQARMYRPRVNAIWFETYAACISSSVILLISPCGTWCCLHPLASNRTLKKDACQKNKKSAYLLDSSGNIACAVQKGIHSAKGVTIRFRCETCKQKICIWAALLLCILLMIPSSYTW